MLQYIDSGIGFILIMLTISLVIMVLMQAVSSVLDLRGRNLVWAMEQLFKQISPDTKSKIVTTKDLPGNIDKFKHFLKTKSNNLLRARFAKVTVAEEIANAIANHPAIAPNASSLATAIRPEEITDVLKAIKDGTGRQAFYELDAKTQAQINALLQPVERARPDIQAVNTALSEIDRLVPAQAAEVKNILNAAIAATSSATVDKVMAAVRTEAADKMAAIEVKLQSEVAKVTALEQGVEKWFNTVMDHASTRFTKHNRFWTLVIAIGLTVFFRVDSIEIFTQIFSSPELQAKLVSAADGVNKQAEEILQRKHVGSQALEDLVAQGKVSDATKTQLATIPPNRDTCADGAAYLQGISTATDAEKQAFNTICDDKQKAILGNAGSDIKQLTNRLDSQSLSVFNQVKWSDLFEGGAKLTALCQEFRGHLRGLVLTVLLLSLGAPFWFDALKNLVSLRPTIAGKVDQETAATKPGRA